MTSRISHEIADLAFGKESESAQDRLRWMRVSDENEPGDYHATSIDAPKQWLRAEYAEPTEDDFSLLEIHHELIVVSTQVRQLRQLVEELRSMAALWGGAPAREPSWQGAFCTELYSVFAAAAVDGWAGQGSSAVSAKTVELTRRLVSQLPSEVPKPEVTAEAAGALMLDWWGPPGYTVTFVVGPDNHFVYAALFGKDSLHGTEQIGDDLPMVARVALKRLFNRATPSTLHRREWGF